MQPFETKRFACVINGEIYNYKSLISIDCELRSNSDCEVVVHLFERLIHGTEPTLEHFQALLNLLDGEFAIIIYDIEMDQVFYAVDQVCRKREKKKKKSTC